MTNWDKIKMAVLPTKEENPDAYARLPSSQSQKEEASEVKPNLEKPKSTGVSVYIFAGLATVAVLATIIALRYGSKRT